MAAVEFDVSTIVIAFLNLVGVVGALIGVYVKIISRIVKLETTVTTLCAKIEAHYVTRSIGKQ